jgi:predicted nuclease with TOPRIM domain
MKITKEMAEAAERDQLLGICGIPQGDAIVASIGNSLVTTPTPSVKEWAAKVEQLEEVNEVLDEAVTALCEDRDWFAERLEEEETKVEKLKAENERLVEELEAMTSDRDWFAKRLDEVEEKYERLKAKYYDM